MYIESSLDPILEHITERIPPLTKSKVRELIIGADAFTPDGYPLIGELPEVSKLIIKHISHKSHL